MNGQRVMPRRKHHRVKSSEMVKFITQVPILRTVGGATSAWQSTIEGRVTL
jgi:hypothetical protein